MKIENEGFNNQKNGTYDIEHLNSRGQQCDEKPLPNHPDSGYHHADLSVIQYIKEKDRTEHKKYIFKVTGKFSKPHSNGILHLEIHNGVSRMTR